MKLSPLEVACCAAIAIVITVTWLHSCEGKKPSESKSVKTVVVEAPMEKPARKVGWATITETPTDLVVRASVELVGPWDTNKGGTN